MQLRIQAGGTLNPRQHIYISRPEDYELFKLLVDGQYANILTSRQTGKSSLVISTIYRLRDRGVRTAYVDLTSIGTPEKVEHYYKGLLYKIARDLRLGINVEDWWHGIAGETHNQQLMRFFRDVVAGAADSPAVVFLDEIDSTLKLDFTDDLFTALRAMYNERSLVPAYERIAFCLVGVATPNELIKDRRTTAYNVGRTLELRDFDARRDNLAPLAMALSGESRIGNAMLARVLHWTDGHPYLTMHVVLNMIERGARSADDVEWLIEETFQTLDRVSSDVHFQQILRFIETRLSHGPDSLSLYQGILEGKWERDTPTLAHTELKLSGLVKRDLDGFLVVRNRIYARLFDRRWVEGARARLSGLPAATSG
jgi:AAA-like domain